eukprot:GFUD01008737.1.p1 GENE.GFUD01008737.1~~GFUD01008737.1.p1  ORF type:complete len:129 (-),score=40.07 GFUD01008737.1:280-666(-)
MAEHSSEEDSSYEDNSVDGDESCEDTDYDYTGEESNPCESDTPESPGDRCRYDWKDDKVSGCREDRGDEWQYCERERNTGAERAVEPPQVYAPERGPPLLDFLFVLTAFFAAAFAAFYTILNETGIPN